MDLNLVQGTSNGRKLIVIKSTQIFLLAAIILMTLVITVICIGILVRYEVKTNVWRVDSVGYWKDELAEEQKFWYNDGIEELKTSLKVNWKQEDARNVILFVTHGVGEEALAAARFSKGDGRARKMVWEDFSHIGRIVTNCNTTTACDAYSFGTALFGGVETTKGVGGLDSTVAAQNCTQSMNETHQIKSILRMAQESNFRNGFVTTKRVSGPLMSSLYAHTADTSWECDTAVPPSKLLQGCKDIATQLIDDETGIDMNVIMGGGRQTLVSSVPISDWDPLDETICNSRDDRNYIREWRTLKRSKGQSNAAIQNISELSKLNGSSVDYVMGIFANGNIMPPWKHTTKDNHMPNLDNMVEKALDVLKRQYGRFLLVVETGNEFGNDIEEQIKELKCLNTTMDKTMRDVSNETLLIVLFVENGSAISKSDSSNKTVPNLNDISGNIRILADGPSSYLFHGLHDETYIAHAVSFALKIGAFRKPISIKHRK